MQCGFQGGYFSQDRQILDPPQRIFKSQHHNQTVVLIEVINILLEYQPLFGGLIEDLLASKFSINKKCLLHMYISFNLVYNKQEISRGIRRSLSNLGYKWVGNR